MEDRSLRKKTVRKRPKSDRNDPPKATHQVEQPSVDDPVVGRLNVKVSYGPADQLTILTHNDMTFGTIGRMVTVLGRRMLVVYDHDNKVFYLDPACVKLMEASKASSEKWQLAT